MFHFALKDINAAKRFRQSNLITLSCICIGVTLYNRTETIATRKTTSTFFLKVGVHS